MEKMKVYISGPFTFASQPDEIVSFYELIGELCSKLGMVPYMPHQKTNPWNFPDLSPDSILTTDKVEVLSSQLMIAYVGTPSHGVGMELAYAESAHIPIILLYEKGAKISRILHGIPTVIAEVAFLKSQDLLQNLKDVLFPLSVESFPMS